jgi:hypothetical protein
MQYLRHKGEQRGLSDTQRELRQGETQAASFFAQYIQQLGSSLPINLRDPDILLGARHTEADRIGDPFGHRRQREASVEAEAVATEVLIKVEGMEGAVEAGLEVG